MRCSEKLKPKDTWQVYFFRKGQGETFADATRLTELWTAAVRLRDPHTLPP